MERQLNVGHEFVYVLNNTLMFQTPNLAFAFVVVLYAIVEILHITSVYIQCIEEILIYIVLKSLFPTDWIM